MDFDSKLKHVLVTLGFKHRNSVLSLRLLGNGVDTTKRTAWFRYEVTWKRSPSAQLLDDLRGVAPVQPTTQAYARDIDRIALYFDCPAIPNEA